MGAARAAIVALVALNAIPWTACGGHETPAPDTTAAPTGVRLAGQVRRDDKWLKVAPEVLHDGKMDLATRCLLLRDEAKSRGQEAPLCYAPTRKPGRAVTTIAVDRDRDMAHAMMRLTAHDLGVHFVIDKNGAIYQLLDLAYVARHGDAYPEDEVRVVACERKAEAALIEALRTLYPTAQVVTKEAPPGDTP